MDDDVLRRFQTQFGRSSSDHEEDRDELDLGCFGWMRGMRERSVMLELRKRTGHLIAVPYGFIDLIEFEPSHGIVVTAGRTRVELAGHGFSRETRPGVSLLAGIINSRVSWVREAGSLPLSTLGACIVDRIDW